MVRRSTFMAALVAAASMAWGATAAHAQFAPRARPNFGSAGLRAGFTPDPHVMAGALGGQVQASQVNSACRGYISPQPNHVVSSRTGFRNLRFVVNAQRDSTLMVMLPNGQILCDDDGGENMNPLIEGSVSPGDIRIWVGAYSTSSVGTPYTIGITEMSHITANNLPSGGMQAQPPPQIMPVGVQPQMAPSFGMLNLRSGFMPDPQVASGTSGGPVVASQVDPRCRGHISPQPSHVIMSQTGFRNLRLIVNAGADLTLVVMLPNGQFVCDDDGGDSNNPLVTTASPPGPIRVWVGSYSANRSAPYNIGISELGHVGTANIPPPGGGPVMVQPVQPVQPVMPVADVVEMQVSIPVTLLGGGVENTVALWNPRGAPPTQISLSGRTLMAGGVSLGSVPPSMRDPVITVMQQRNGDLVVRAEQPPMGRGDRGATMLLLIRWAGRPSVAERWSGTAVQRGPRWSR